MAVVSGGIRGGMPDEAPLAGIVVWNTRPRDDGAGEDALSRALAAAGARELRLPTARVRPAEDLGELDAALREAERVLAWVFTSPRAVRVTDARARELGVRPAYDGGRGPAPAVWAVGPQTAHAVAGSVFRALPLRALEGRGGRDLWPALRAKLPSPAPARDTLVWPRSSLAATSGWKALLDLGYRGLAPVAYETEPVPEDLEAVRRAAQDPRGGVIWLASPSAVRGLAGAWPGAARDRSRSPEASPLGAWRVACIGPTTAAACEAEGLPVHAVAASPSPEAAVAAIAAALDPANAAARGLAARDRRKKG
ncbi:MAG: uroporphyrinogen-III synthase [Clostridia bacterium]|nr:uroporphyrinogen-III synthase [Clostridia bacterium]